MSAWFVTPETIADAVAACRKWGNRLPSPHPTAGDTVLGKHLWNLNVDALVQRYGDDPREYAEQIGRLQSFPPASQNDAQLFKSLHCLLYQCSEGDVPRDPLYRYLAAVTEVAEGTGLACDGTAWQAAEWNRKPLNAER